MAVKHGAVPGYAARAPCIPLAPSTLANMAAPKVLVIWLKMNYCIYTQYIFVGRYGMELKQSSTLLGRVREVIRYKHYSIRTERSYVEWVRHRPKGFILTSSKHLSFLAVFSG